MSSFGENLRREREIREVSLQEIADFTKINLRFLEAIEEEDFGKLPGGVFNRGFIRAYTQHLGLDDVKVLSEYDLIEGVQESVLRVHLHSQATEPQPTGSQARWLAAILGVFMLIAGYALFRYAQQPFSSNIGANPTRGEIPAPFPPETQPGQSSAVASTGTSVEGSQVVVPSLETADFPPTAVQPAPASVSEELVLAGGGHQTLLG